MNNFITGGHLVSFILYQFELSFALEVRDVYMNESDLHSRCISSIMASSERLKNFCDERIPEVAVGANSLKLKNYLFIISDDSS